MLLIFSLKEIAAHSPITRFFYVDAIFSQKKTKLIFLGFFFKKKLAYFNSDSGPPAMLH